MTDKQMVEAYFLSIEKKLRADIEQSYRRERIAIRIAFWSGYGLIYAVYSFVILRITDSFSVIPVIPALIFCSIPFILATLIPILSLQDNMIEKLNVRQERESESLRLGIKQMRKDAGL